MNQRTIDNTPSAEHETKIVAALVKSARDAMDDFFSASRLASISSWSVIAIASNPTKLAISNRSSTESLPSNDNFEWVCKSALMNILSEFGLNLSN